MSVKCEYLSRYRACKDNRKGGGEGRVGKEGQEEREEGQEEREEEKEEGRLFPFSVW